MTTTYYPESATVGSAVSDLNGATKDWTVVSDLGVITSTGERVPNWRRAIREHPVVTGSLSAGWQLYDYDPCQQAYGGRTRNNPSDPWQPFEAYSVRLVLPWPYTLPDEGNSDKALNQALAKLTSRVRQSTQACQGLVVLGELKETLDFIARPGRGIQSTLKDWMRKVEPLNRMDKRHLSRRTVRRLQRNLRRQWLETSYALLPLLSEAEQAAQYFNSKSSSLENLYDVFKATGTATQSHLGPRQEYIAGHFGVSFHGKYTNLDTVKFRGAMVANGSGPDARSVGLDLTSWLPSIWNLIPYSFIVDYFTNLGGLIDTWAIRNIFGAGLQQTIWHETITEAINVSPIDLGVMTPWAETYLAAHGGGFYRRTTGAVSRQRIASLPTPVLQARCPGVSSKWINIIALADAFLSRGDRYSKYFLKGSK